MRSCLFLLLFCPVAFGTEMWLGVGDVRSVPAPAGAPVRVGGRGIVRVIDGARSVRVVAIKPGAVTLVIGAQVIKVRVTDREQLAFDRDLRRTIGAMRGLSVDWSRARPEVTGTLLRFADWRLIAEIARRHRGAYAFRARVLRDVGEEAIHHLQDLVRARGYPPVRFVAAPDFTAVVPRATGELRAEVERGLLPYGIRVDGAKNELRVEPLVRTRLVLAEVTRGFSRVIGVRWPDQYAAQVLPNVGGERDLLASLRALEASGQAQVLASPDLSCRSGGEARFLAGGELPIRVASRNRQGVEWKSFGVSLNVRPRADEQGHLSLDLKTEISLADFAHAVDGIPALKKNVVESQFDLPGTRTIALSGLIRHESGSGADGVPFLSQLPLLGRLFSSRQFQRHRSELVVFVTPEIDVPSPDAKVRLPEDWVSDD